MRRGNLSLATAVLLATTGAAGIGLIGSPLDPFQAPPPPPRRRGDPTLPEPRSEEPPLTRSELQLGITHASKRAFNEAMEKCEAKRASRRARNLRNAARCLPPSKG